MIYKELRRSTNKRENLSELFRLIQEAYNELGVHTSKISRLELRHFSDLDAPRQNYPDIMHSAIKARQMRYLAPVAAKLRKDFLHGYIYSKHRLACLTNLTKSYDLVDARLGVDEPMPRTLAVRPPQHK